MMSSNPHHPSPKNRRSIRLKGYDYTQPGGYYITICTHHRFLLFGDIVEDKMVLSAVGHIVQKELERLPQRFSYLRLGAFVVMPNHTHAILYISDSDKNTDASRHAPTQEKLGKPVPGSIPTVIRSYKSAVSLRANRLKEKPVSPIWQGNYYEHVIRDEDELAKIHDYIMANPLCWDEDEENPNHHS